MRDQGGKPSKTQWTIILVICCICFLGCIGYIIYHWVSNRQAQQDVEQLAEQYISTMPSETESAPIDSAEDSEVQDSSEETTIPPDTETETVPEEENLLDTLENYDIRPWQIDFDGLKQECEDIYAWIYVPGTEVDYPIVQHPTDTAYYLKKDIHGKNVTAGAIFTEYYNSKDWTDYNTVIYGHNMRNGSMFASLHRFEKEDFFDEYRYVYIYTPEVLKVYEIFAAYVYSNAHLMLSFDTSTEEGFAEYLEEVFSQKGESRALFHDEVEVTPEDHIITLSTCIGSDNHRYLVQAKLVAEGTWMNEDENAAESTENGI